MKVRSRALGAEHQADLNRRQRDAFVQPRNGRIVPVGDPSQEDIGQHGAAELQIRGHAGHVVNRHDRPDNRRQMHDASGRGEQLLLGHRRVGCAEEDELVGQLPDAPARSNRLIRELDIGLRFAYSTNHAE